jgi:predicted  nucleic acid-binding Zn-ribbon protein
LNKHLEELIELSKLDKSIDEFTPLIKNAEKKLARRVAKRDEIIKKIDEINIAIEDNNAKIVSFENQIKALNEQLAMNIIKERAIKTEREMKALQMESELAREKLNFVNEEIEKLNRILETKERELKGVNRDLEKADNELNRVSLEVSAKIASIEEEKGKLFDKRERKIRDIDQKILSFYEKIRIWARNSAVVPVKKQACYGCYMKLNDSAYAEVIKSEDICTCHHCGRILYIEPQTEEVGV